MRVKLDTTTNVTRSLTRISNAVLAGDLDVKRANCIVYACNCALGAIKVAPPPTEDFDKAKEILDAVSSVIDNKE